MPHGTEGPSDDHPWDSPPPPPDDRLWRHPSEMTTLGPPSALAASHPPRRNGAVMLCVVGMGVLIVGSIAVTSWLEGTRTTNLPAVDQARFMSSTTAVSQVGWLGVNAIDSPVGVTVIACDAGSPAQVALRQGDLILAVDGVPTPTMADVRLRVEAALPGTLITLDVVRHHVTLRVQVPVAQR